MGRSDNLYQLPVDLPVPIDDGAARHLPGLRIPSLVLQSTSGRKINLSELNSRTIVYCYPRTGRPDEEPPPGWNEIPGARGCTPQAAGFRDYYDDIKAFGVSEVFGLSTQDTVYQCEAVQRLRLQFAMLSDEKLAFAKALNLPTFDVEGMTLIKRLTLVLHAGAIEHVFYPVFP